MSVETDIRNYILATGAITSAGCFVGPVRPPDPARVIPQKAVFIARYGGFQANGYMDNADTDYRRHNVQLQVRCSGEDWAAGADLAELIWGHLQRASIDGYVRIVNLQSSPTYLGRDDQECHLWSINIQCDREEEKPNSPTLMGDPDVYNSFFYFRLYYSQIRDNILPVIEADVPAWKARYPRTGFMVLTQIPQDAAEIAGTNTVLYRLEQAGIDAFPGFRLYEGWNIAAVFTTGFMAQQAAAFSALFSLRKNANPRFGFDAEAYGSPDLGQPTTASLIAAGYTVEQYTAAIQPLVDEIRTRRRNGYPIMLCIHPAVHGDEGVRALMGACEGEGELWLEDTFGAVETTRRRGQQGNYGDAVTYNQSANLELVDYPLARHRPVYDDDILRSWKGWFGNDPISNDDYTKFYSRYGGWIFDSTRADQSISTSTKWYAGVGLSTLNFIQYVWEAGRYNINPFYAMPPTGLGTTTYQAPYGNIQHYGVLRGYLNDSENDSDQGYERSSAGFRFPTNTGTNTFGLRDKYSILPITADTTTPAWTIDAQFIIPSVSSGQMGTRYPLMCAAQSNTQDWEVAYDETDNKIKLHIKTGSTTQVSLDVVSAVTQDVATRVTIGREGSKWRAGSTTTTGLAPAGNMSYLALGLGWSSFTTTGVRTMAKNLLWTGPLHCWTRFLGTAEYSALFIQGGRFPWGYST